MKDCLIQIPLNAPLDYHMSGKFEAPSDDWMHEDFDLTDFELIIMTENVLYIEYNHTPFTVHQNEYLLLPPLAAPGNRRNQMPLKKRILILPQFVFPFRALRQTQPS